jgi:hypothetical protein
MLQHLLAFLISVMLIMQPLLAVAGSSPMLIPTNPVTLLATGLVVDKEIPAPSGMLMACTGECVVEADGLQLIGADKTVFSLEEGSTRYLVTIMDGELDFALRSDAKPLAIKTPFQDPADTNRYLIPASSDEVLRGTLQIDNQKGDAILAMRKGSLKLVAIDGQKLVHAGNAIFLPRHPAPGENSLSFASASHEAETSFSGLAVGAGALAILAVTGMALAGGGGGGGGGGGSSPASPH